MATNEATLDHLATVRSAVNAAINNVHRYAGFNGEMTTSAKNALLATVTTVPAALQHASNCSICNGWDGSVAPSE
jgi:hypothetical protein